MTRATQIRIPSPDSKTFRPQIVEVLDLWAGNRNNGLDRVLTAQDLVALGIAATNYNVNPPTSSTSGDSTPPGAPTNVSVTTVGLNSHQISWTNPTDTDLYYIVIFCAEVAAGATAPIFADAERISIITEIGNYGENDHTTRADIDALKDYYYWLAAVDWSGNMSSIAFAGSALFEDSPTINNIIEALKGEDPDEYSSSIYYEYKDRIKYTSGDICRRFSRTNYLSGAVNNQAPTGDLDDLYWDRMGILMEGEIDGDSVVGIDGHLVVDGTIMASSIRGDAFGTLTISSGSIVITTAQGNMQITSGGTLSIGSSSTLSILSGGVLSVVSGGDINVASGGEINIASGASINIESGGNIDILSGGSIDVASNGDINIASGGGINVASGGDININSGGEINVVSGGYIDIESGGELRILSGGDMGIYSGATLTVASGGDLTLSSGAVLTITGGSGQSITMDGGGDIVISGPVVIESGAYFGDPDNEHILVNSGQIQLKDSSTKIAWFDEYGTHSTIQPSVLVALTGGASNITGDGTWYTINWDTEIEDQGYDMSSLNFTASCDGRYLFTFAVGIVDVSGVSGSGRLVTSNRTYYMDLLSRPGSTSYGTLTGSVVADMDTNDTASLGVMCNGGSKDAYIASSSDPRIWMSVQLLS